MPQAPGICTLLVDDRLLAIAGLKTIVQEYPELELVGEASEHDDAIAKVRELSPAVVVIDSLAHSLDALDLTRTLTRDSSIPRTKVLALANVMNEDAWQLMRAGAHGVLLKNSEPTQLVAAIRMVAAGYSLFTNPAPAGCTDIPLPSWSIANPQAAALDQLTSREFEVLKLVAQAHTNAEISATLHVSQSTVKSHVRHILEKLGLRNRIHVALYALQIGLVDVDAGRVFSSTYWRQRDCDTMPQRDTG